MIYPRVNLLKKNELRYQGAVSSNFILLCSIGVPVILILIATGLGWIHNMNIQSQLTSSRALWENLEPRLESHKKGNQRLVTNRKILGLFDGWEASRASFVSLMDDIQNVVPDSVQFTRMSIRIADSRSLYKTTEELQLDYSLLIEGIAQGAQSEKQVIDFQKDLLDCKEVGATFASLKLASFRKRSGAEGGNKREFRLVGATQEGGVE